MQSVVRRTYEKPSIVKRSLLPMVVAGTGGEVPSDRRLKTAIVGIGTLMAGIPLYRFRYFWSGEEYVGVMAQDVARVVPDAVTTDASGFMRVDYARLGTRMMRWDKWRTLQATIAA